jgi:hypothetical protein
LTGPEGSRRLRLPVVFLIYMSPWKLYPKIGYLNIGLRGLEKRPDNELKQNSRRNMR